MKTTIQPKKIKLNKDVIYGFIAVVLISCFAYAVGNIFSENSEKQLLEIRNVQQTLKSEKHQAELREQKANFKRDSALSVLGRQTTEINLMNKNFTTLNTGIFNMQSLFNKQLNELKNIQNEKDHITDAPISEQYDFITKFRYKEY